MSEKIEKDNTVKIDEEKKSLIFKKPTGKFFVFIFGFLFPFIALVVELTTRICAGNFFDPLPTYYHALLIGIIPITSLFYIFGLNEKNIKLISFLSGICLSVSGFYAIIFIPIIPIGIIAILFFGLGILPLSPLMAMIASLIMMRFSIKTKSQFPKSIIAGLVLGLFFILSLELPVTLTRYAMQLADSENKDTKISAVKFLRNYGSKNIMLRYCYIIRGQSPDLISFFIERGGTISPEKARDIYYQVTGKTFNSVPPPKDLKSRLQITDEFIFDEDQSTENVGLRLKGLDLSSSKIDGIIDQKSGTTYSEWIMTFKNTASWDQEARFQIKTPPDSTVSRLTLWINGEEREAAFAGKEQVQKAYQSIVAKRRDPVLVTSKGVDRFLVQCFPVPINKEMKIRIGISSPMNFENKKESLFVLPQIIERNFSVNKEFKHSVWYDSKNPISTEDQSLNTLFSKDKFSLKGLLDNEKIESFPYVIKIKRKDQIKDTWTTDTVNNKYIISQKVKDIDIKGEKKLTFVIDGSLETAKYSENIKDIIGKLSNSINTKVIIAGDYIENIEGRDNLDIAQKISNYSFEGGRSNFDALTKAVENSDSPIIWLHGVQPETNYSDYYKSEDLINTIKKMDKKPINELQFSSGTDIVSQNTASYKVIKSIPITGDFKQTLDSFINKLTTNHNEIYFERNRVLKSDQKVEDISSMHLEKVWANTQVHKLLITNNQSTEAVKIASSYHIVTPVSGAVVLENAKQFEENNLKPVDKSTVPIIPEPEEWLLIGIVLLFIGYSVYRKKQLCLKV